MPKIPASLPEGQPNGDYWLPMNQAYQRQLLEAHLQERQEQPDSSTEPTVRTYLTRRSAFYGVLVAAVLAAGGAAVKYWPGKNPDSPDQATSGTAEPSPVQWPTGELTQEQKMAWCDTAMDEVRRLMAREMKSENQRILNLLVQITYLDPQRQEAWQKRGDMEYWEQAYSLGIDRYQQALELAKNQLQKEYGRGNQSTINAQEENIRVLRGRMELITRTLVERYPNNYAFQELRGDSLAELPQTELFALSSYIRALELMRSVEDYLKKELEKKKQKENERGRYRDVDPGHWTKEAIDIFSQIHQGELPLHQDPDVALRQLEKAKKNIFQKAKPLAKSATLNDLNSADVWERYGQLQQLMDDPETIMSYAKAAELRKKAADTVRSKIDK